MSVTKEELEPKMFEMISWGLDKTDLDDVEGDEFIELTTYIANRALEILKDNINE